MAGGRGWGEERGGKGSGRGGGSGVWWHGFGLEGGARALAKVHRGADGVVFDHGVFRDCRGDGLVIDNSGCTVRECVI